MDVINTLFALPVKTPLGTGTTLRQIGELEVLIVDTPYCQAAVSLQGAQLLAWKPASQPRQVLWLSGTTPFQTGVPIRGGVPVCWPWFTDLGGEPFHGFARLLPWRITGMVPSQRAVNLTLALRDTPQTRQWWDHPFHLELNIILGESHCELTLIAHGDYRATAALHSYFYTPDIAGISIKGTGNQGFDTVAGVNKMLRSLPFTLNGETGIIFSAPEPQTSIHDHATACDVIISHRNNSNIVVWNPGATRAAHINDIPDGSYRNFVCVETACVDRPLVSTHQHPASLGVQFHISAVGSSTHGDE